MIVILHTCTVPSSLGAEKGIKNRIVSISFHNILFVVMLYYQPRVPTILRNTCVKQKYYFVPFSVDGKMRNYAFIYQLHFLFQPNCRKKIFNGLAWRRHCSKWYGCVCLSVSVFNGHTSTQMQMESSQLLYKVHTITFPTEEAKCSERLSSLFKVTQLIWKKPAFISRSFWSWSPDSTNVL